MATARTSGPIAMVSRPSMTQAAGVTDIVKSARISGYYRDMRSMTRDIGGRDPLSGNRRHRRRPPMCAVARPLTPCRRARPHNPWKSTAINESALVLSSGSTQAGRTQYDRHAVTNRRNAHVRKPAEPGTAGLICHLMPCRQGSGRYGSDKERPRLRDRSDALACPRPAIATRTPTAQG